MDADILGENGRSITLSGDNEIGYNMIILKDDIPIESIWFSPEEYKRLKWTMNQCND